MAAPAQADDDGVLPVRVAVVQAIPVTPTERYAATIQPRIESSLAFRVTGKIVSRSVNLGDWVSPGTVLAQLDSTDLDLNRREAQAQVTSAHADLTKAQADFSRGEALLQQGWITRADYDARHQSRDAAAARLGEALEQLKVTEDSVGYSTLRADVAGVITGVDAEPGQVVTVGQEVFRLAQKGQMEAEFDLPEQMVSRLSHTRFAVTLWADPTTEIPATLRELAGSADPATRTYRARLTLPNPPADARLGMTATVIARDTTQGTVVLLPSSALFHDGQAPAVWVLDDHDDGITLRRVVLAAYLDGQIAISAGLRDGERVVTAGAFKLMASDRVRVWTEPDR